MKVRVSVGATLKVGDDYVKAVVDIEDEVDAGEFSMVAERLDQVREHSDTLAKVAENALVERLNEVIEIVEGEIG